jgi:2-oxoglutarate ferredoxin oxidoreductase subunit alpha
MRINILFGGAAGQGPNILTHILGDALVKQGYYVFYSRDYQSLIRGGHNFNVLTFSDKPVNSNDSQLDIIVALDEKTKEMHKKNLKKNGIIIDGNHPNMYYAGRLFKCLGLDFGILDKELKALEKKYEENIKEATSGYKEAVNHIYLAKPESTSKKNNLFMNGNQGIATGAVKSGLDIYYAYPMTPATAILNELAEKQIEDNIFVYELENEIAVVNAGIGSAMTGAKSMVGTSGGGFDLMSEGLSLAGMANVPLVLYLSQRPGPATGIATYTGQGDLNMARHTGHGEFSRLVVAPGNPKEAQELTSQCFYFSQKFAIPSIILGDKHLAESFYTLTEQGKITKSTKTAELKRYNSYEQDPETGSATEDAEIIKKEVEKRLAKRKEIISEASKFEQYKVYGKKENKNLIISWGSTQGAILDAIEELDCEFIQILYIEPFPKEIKKLIERKNLILVENNATGMLAELITEKTGIFIDDKNKILRYDGRPFLADELKEEIEGRLR